MSKKDNINKLYKEIIQARNSGLGVDQKTNLLINEFDEDIKIIINKTVYNKSDFLDGDLNAKGMEGLVNALDSFKEGKNASFYTYACTCIKNKVLEYVRSESNRLNKITIGSTKEDSNGDVTNVLDNLEDTSLNPEEELIQKEEESLVNKRLNNLLNALNEQQKEILMLHIEGVKPKEIALRLNLNYKAVDNALQQIKKKASKI